MKELTKNKKIALFTLVYHLLATIPEYDLTMHEREMEYYHILITDEGYIGRTYEYGDSVDSFLAKHTRKRSSTLYVFGLLRMSVAILGLVTFPTNTYPPYENRLCSLCSL